MKKQAQKWLMLLGLLGVVACSPRLSDAPLSSGTETEDTEGNRWQETCLRGTIEAFNMEIDRYTGWLQTADGEQAAMYQQALDYLQKELQAYENLSPAEYTVGSAWRYIPGVVMGTYGRDTLPPVPERIKLEDAWLEEDGLLHYEGMSRSGPFYTLVPTNSQPGIQTGVHYRMEIQPIMPVSYPFPSYYVCLYTADVLK